MEKNDLDIKNNQLINELKNYQNENQNSITINNKNNLPRQNASSLMSKAGLAIINSTSNNFSNSLNQKKINNNISSYLNKNNEKNKKTINKYKCKKL